MRVLHVSPYFAPAMQYGGPPASILGLCQALQRAGVEVEVVTTTANGGSPLPASPRGGVRHDGVPVHYVAASFPRRFFGAGVRQPLNEALARADVCHIHGVWNVPEWWASRLARAARVPYVISPRGMLQPEARQHGRWRKAAAYALLEHRNLTHARLLHATSDQEAAALRGLDLGVRIAMVPNGVGGPAPHQATVSCRARLGIPADAFVVLFLGRMHRIKRLDLLAEAFAIVRRTHPSAHLVLAGPDEQQLIPGLLRRLAGHAAGVHTPGAIDGTDKWAMLKAADVTVQCSDSESFGLAVVESLASGVPVVATRTCPWSVLEARECGLWVEQTADAIAAALRTLADDPERRARMGERAAALARDEYSWDVVATAMSRLYGEVMKGEDVRAR
jgi:glycosyltransferase involved in cell wall biosynthesis